MSYGNSPASAGLNFSVKRIAFRILLSQNYCLFSELYVDSQTCVCSSYQSLLIALYFSFLRSTKISLTKFLHYGVIKVLCLSSRHPRLANFYIISHSRLSVNPVFSTFLEFYSDQFFPVWPLRPGVCPVREVLYHSIKDGSSCQPISATFFIFLYTLSVSSVMAANDRQLYYPNKSSFFCQAVFQLFSTVFYGYFRICRFVPFFPWLCRVCTYYMYLKTTYAWKKEPLARSWEGFLLLMFYQVHCLFDAVKAAVAIPEDRVVFDYWSANLL